MEEIFGLSFVPEADLKLVVSFHHWVTCIIVAWKD